MQIISEALYPLFIKKRNQVHHSLVLPDRKQAVSWFVDECQVTAGRNFHIINIGSLSKLIINNEHNFNQVEARCDGKIYTSAPYFRGRSLTSFFKNGKLHYSVELIKGNEKVVWHGMPHRGHSTFEEISVGHLRKMLKCVMKHRLRNFHC